MDQRGQSALTETLAESVQFAIADHVLLDYPSFCCLSVVIYIIDSINAPPVSAGASTRQLPAFTTCIPMPHSHQDAPE
jgi:hypothetical protein